MIRFRKPNPKNPEQKNEVVLDLVPVILFMAGYLGVKGLLDAFDV